jgi:hypothetical protein
LHKLTTTMLCNNYPKAGDSRTVYNAGASSGSKCKSFQ